MIVLDTNFLSELARPSPSQAVIEWVDAHNSSDLAITVAHGKREIGLRMESLLTETFAGYVLVFDIDSSAHYAEILATRTRNGRPISAFDAQIAPVCRQYASTLATRKTADFTDTGIQVINPWDAT